MSCLSIFELQFQKNYCHICNQHSWICQAAKYREIMKMPKFGAKTAWFVYFWAGIWKQYCHVRNQHPQICLFVKFHEKTKMPKFGTKNALFGYFWARILKKSIVIFEILTLKFFYLKNFMKKQKSLNLGPKMPDLGILGLEFESNIVIFEICTLEFV